MSLSLLIWQSFFSGSGAPAFRAPTQRRPALPSLTYSTVPAFWPSTYSSAFHSPAPTSPAHTATCVGRMLSLVGGFFGSISAALMVLPVPPTEAGGALGSSDVRQIGRA